MKSPLDMHNWTKWFLEKFSYFDFELELILAEGIRDSIPDENAPVPGAHKVAVQPESKRFQVLFDYVLLLQVIDESHLKPNKEEIGSDGVLQKFKKSAFLDYAAATCDFLAHDKYNHYRIKTTNEFLDVISLEAPEINEIKS